MFDSIRLIFVKLYVHIRKILIGSGIGKFYIIEVVNNAFLAHMKKDYVVIFGNKMFLDKDDALELSINEIYEPDETHLIQSLINPVDIVLDIGAHIGYYTLIFSKLVGETGKVFAFEPDIYNFDLLEKNVNLNDCHNVVLMNVAVTDKTEKVKLFRTDASSNLNLSNNFDNLDYYIVDGVSLDEYLKTLNRPVNFIKMDIEGSEYSVLSGAKTILENNPDVSIISEFYPFALNKSNKSPNEFITLLASRFRLYEIDEGNHDVVRTNPEELLQKYTVDNKKLTNLLCVKIGVASCTIQ